MNNKEFGFETRAIHAGQACEPITGAVVTPLYLTSTFEHSAPGEHSGYEYSRSGNPTRTAYETCVANLESARFGFAMASGCLSVTVIMHLFDQGDHILCCDDVYGGTQRMFNQVFSRHGLEFSYLDMTGNADIENALQPNTKAVWIESPTNPLMKLIDIKKLAELCKARGILLIVDNTFMSPYFQRPIELGADIVMHSTTKYINGHSDLIGGVVITDDESIAEQLSYLSNAMGSIQSVFDSFMCLRSLKTLAIRMQAHEQNALAIAQFLERHKKIEKVMYPGLESHPQHTLAQEQMSGFGGMLSFYVKGGLEDASKLLRETKLFILAESLGGVESLIEHPGLMTHASMPEEARLALGIDDTLIRMSVGIETCDDLIRDLAQALN